MYSRTLESEFDAPCYTIPELFKSRDWEPDMWHNNTSPAYFHRETATKVWVETDNPEFREVDDMARFTIQKMDEYGEEPADDLVYQADTDEELIEVLKNFGID